MSITREGTPLVAVVGMDGHISVSDAPLDYRTPRRLEFPFSKVDLDWDEGHLKRCYLLQECVSAACTDR